MKNQITTKCVCIIRHQKGYKKPKIYEVNLKSRNYGMYNFEKGKEICENVEKVVSDRNKLIKDNKVGNDYEKYFLIIEYEIPFFKGEMEKYADIFEFMDVPGLNEAIDSKTKNQNETENTIVNNFYFSRIFPLIKNNIKFSLFIFSQDNYANSNTMEILMAYVFQEKKTFGETKFDQINELKKKEKKEIKKYVSLASFQESIFILNKMDKVEEKKREEKVKKFQDWIYENFREEIKIKLKEETKEYNNNLLEKQLNNYDIHLGEENFIGMMGKKLNEESSKMDSFKEYLEYYISNSNVYEINSEDFSHYIEERKNNDFNIDFNNESINKKKPKKLEGKDLENYEKFIELFKKNTTFDGFLSKEEYYTYKQLFEKFKDNYTETEEKRELEKLIKKK